MPDLFLELLSALHASDENGYEKIIKEFVAREEHCVPPLMSVMWITSKDVIRELIIKELQKIDNDDIPDLAEAIAPRLIRTPREEMVNLILTIGDPALEAVDHIIQKQDKYSFGFAFDTLVHANPITIPLLISLSCDKNSRVCKTAVSSLTRIGEKAASAIPTLRQILASSHDYDLRLVIGRAFGVFGDQGLHELKEMLTSSAIDVRRAAIYGLPENDTQEVVGILTQALSDTAWQVRWAAAHRLGDVGRHAQQETVLQQLRLLEGDPHWRVVREATYFINWIEDGIEWKRISQQRDAKSD